VGGRAPDAEGTSKRDTPADCETRFASAQKASALPHRTHVLRSRAIWPCANDSGRRIRGRKAALAKLLPMQRGDFAEIFRIMADGP